ncbi:MAG TPA: hypothetical protein VIK33_07305 [Anaerolineae bacterium]
MPRRFLLSVDGNYSRALRREMNLPAKSMSSAEADFRRVDPAALA